MPMARTEWARLGALTRLQQIDHERAAILRAFPDLRGSRQPKAAPVSGRGRAGRKMSAAARRRMSRGMKKYWAKKRAGKA
jgi:hypothetical protein